MDGEHAIRHVINAGIEGVLVECGVESGNFEERWIRELQKHAQTRDIYMYDTFAGLTEPSEYDYTADSARLYKMDSTTVHQHWKRHQRGQVNGWCYTPQEKVSARLNATGYPPDKLHYIVGDVSRTLMDPQNLPDQIAILRLDTDWYQSSKVELEVLYPRVVTGGVVIFDDYFHWDGQRRATDEYFASIHESPTIVNLGNGKTGAFIKR